VSDWLLYPELIYQTNLYSELVIFFINISSIEIVNPNHYTDHGRDFIDTE
jgi:hypothetical protein